MRVSRIRRVAPFSAAGGFSFCADAGGELDGAGLVRVKGFPGSDSPFLDAPTLPFEGSQESGRIRIRSPSASSPRTGRTKAHRLFIATFY
jgi:hypothetical protein